MTDMWWHWETKTVLYFSLLPYVAMQSDRWGQQLEDPATSALRMKDCIRCLQGAKNI
jgi:hypothetical protein